MYYVGVDVGTSSLKCTVMNEERNIVYTTGKEYQVISVQDGYKEFEPSVWYEKMMECLEDIFNKYPDVSVMGITGQMHSSVFLDSNDQIIRPAILWNDLRTASILKEIKEECARYEETKYISRLVSTGSPFMSAYWLKENEAESFSRIDKIMTPNAYLTYRLTGVHCLDLCQASTTSFYDIQSKSWSKIMFEWLGLKESVFGQLKSASDIIGSFTFHDHKVNVITGTGDNPSTAYAMGILSHSNPVISLGTAGVMIFPKDGNDIDGKGKNVLFQASGESKIYNVVQGTVQSAGGTHKWWIEKGLKSDDMSLDQEDIHLSDLAKNSVLFYPHIAGEKILHSDISIRGAFIGLSAITTRKDMTQAVFEGIGFAFREILENMNLNTWPSKIQMNGGGTKSKIWMQILADILHTDIEVVTMNATPGYGICLLSYLSCHRDFTVDPVAKGILYKPQPETIEGYNKAFDRYVRIYDALKSIA